MTRTLMLIAALMAAPLAAQAQGVFVPPTGIAERAPLTGLRAHVARELPRFGLSDVDVRSLSNGQVAVINSLIHGGGSHGDVASRIRSQLRRGILSRALN